MNFNLLEAARITKVDRYLYTSSVGVYAQAEILREDDVWKTFPSKNDWYPGWGKRMGELQIEAYRIEFGMKNLVMVRPANVYGPFDNFDSQNAMVIPSLIRRVVAGENPLVVWGDGSAIRDFVFAQDVARGMILAMSAGITDPINLGSGTGITIKNLVETIVKQSDNKPEIVWDTSKVGGDARRLMDISRAKSIGYAPSVSLEEGTRETMKWYQRSYKTTSKRYDIFDSIDNKLIP